MVAPGMRRAAAAVAFIIAASAASVASAHGVGAGEGLVSGFLHPFLGPDHLLAMVAVGLWGAQLGQPMIVVLPVAFPMVMALGGVLGLLNVPLPGVEIGIALSALLLGLAVAFAFRAPIWLAVALVGAFAVYHGHAHGQALPSAASPLPYAVGFVLATGFLHAVGILIGLLNEWKGAGAVVVRACGAVIAALGGYFLAAAAAA